MQKTINALDAEEKKSSDSEDIESILKNGEEHIFEVIIEPDEDAYYAYCPDLQGCRTWGHTEKEALRYIQEAVELYVADLIADGKPIPGIGLVSNIAPIVKLKESKNDMKIFDEIKSKNKGTKLKELNADIREAIESVRKQND